MKGPKPQKRPVKFSLRLKFGAIFLGLFFLASGILGTSFYFIHTLHGDAQAINYAGQERYRSYQLAFSTNRYMLEDEAYRLEIRRTILEKMDEFEAILYGLRDGDPARDLLGVKDDPKRSHDLYDSLTRHINEFHITIRPFILGVINAPSWKEGRAIMDNYSKFMPSYISDIDQTVKLFEDSSRGKLSRFRTLEFVMIGISVGVVVGSIFLISLLVLHPLAKIEDGVREFASGNWHKRIKVNDSDEISTLANGFNNMAEELGREYHELLEQRDKLQELNRLISEASMKDPVTGLYNYYYFQECLATEFANARRYGLPLSLITIDIDYFKMVNDLWGHPFGNFVLKELARVFGGVTRAGDVVARVGGEEFSVVLLNTGLTGACEVGSKLRQAVEDHVFKEGSVSCQVAVSLGVSSLEEGGVDSPADMIRHADQALLEAKARGRNVVLSWAAIRESKGMKVEEEALEDYKQKFLSLEQNIKRSYVDTTLAFLKALEAKDNYSARHSYTVAGYAVKLAQTLGLPAEQVEVIKNAALLHDIGKIGIPEGILGKTSGLSPEEQAIIRRHPSMSVAILEKVMLLEREVPFIYHHQERFDGTGYPSGLKGGAIPLGARILAVADAYEAMTSERPYRQTLSQEEAFLELLKGAGTQFDPELVEVFIRVVRAKGQINRLES